MHLHVLAEGIEGIHQRPVQPCATLRVYRSCCACGSLHSLPFFTRASLQPSAVVCRRSLRRHEPLVEGVLDSIPHLGSCGVLAFLRVLSNGDPLLILHALRLGLLGLLAFFLHRLRFSSCFSGFLRIGGHRAACC